MSKHLRCPKHGRMEWLHTVMCARCECVYQMPTSEDFVFIEGAVGMPEKCECGARLAPEPGVPGGGVYHARPMCTDCFRGVLERAKEAS